MRNAAIGLLVLLLGSIIVHSLVEFVNLGREKMIIGTALTNSARAAKDRSLKYEFMRDLDAIVDEKDFIDYFSEAFEDSLNLSRVDTNGYDTTLEFKSNDDKYNEIIVELDFSDEEDPLTEQKVTTVEMRAETEYKFKTKGMKLAKEAGEDVDYTLVEERTLILSIKN